MDKIFRYGFMSVVFYFGINWLADNPKKINSVRKQVNALVSNFI
tara:strand:- start:157 stop:288 length:132 start_codon:yes stop_codon:yes gene_type:complete